MAAKAIQVSDDNGANWYTLPGSTGEFTSAAEGINDTIFGNTYESNEIGMITWGMSANAYYKGFAGYLAEISAPGTPVNAPTAACTLVTGKIYQLNNTAQRVMDRSGTINVFDNAVNHNADVEWIDYLFGRVKFLDAYTVTTPVTITYDYLPLTALGSAQSYNLTMTAAEIDATTFALAQANGGHRVFQPGLRTVSLELSGIFNSTIDSRSSLVAREELIITIDPAGDGNSIARGFFKYSNVQQGGDVGALEDETLTFLLNTPVDAEFDIQSYFNWVHEAGTLLPYAVRVPLTAFINETLIDARYLPQGTPGQSPLDGKAGDVVVTDISLSGGLSDMNTFAVELRGSGVVTEV